MAKKLADKIYRRCKSKEWYQAITPMDKERAKQLYAAKQRECPTCHKVFDCEPPQHNVHNANNKRYDLAWKLCPDCAKVKKFARNKINYQAANKDCVKKLYHRAKFRNAKGRKKQVECGVTLEYLRKLWEKQDGKCAVTGHPFDVSFANKPYSPSLDRIDSSKGYVPDNVRFVLWAVNAGMNSWGLETYLKLAKMAITLHETKEAGRPNELSLPLDIVPPPVADR